MKLSDLNLLIDSGMPIVCVNAPVQERMTVLAHIYHKCGISRNLPVYLWNEGWGYFNQVECDLEDKIVFSEFESGLQPKNESVLTAFDYLLNNESEGIYILENLPSLISSGFKEKCNCSSTKIVSQLINLHEDLINTIPLKYLVILSTEDIELPQSLSNLIPTLSTPLPSTGEINNLITQSLQKLMGELFDNLNISNFVNAASGLTHKEITLGLAIAVRSSGELNTDSITKHLLSYKIDRFRSFNLNFVAKPSVPDFGGLDLLKKFIAQVKQDFLPDTRGANIPLPKGCLLVGPPGTGKTLAAHVSAKNLGFPLVSVDTATVLVGGATYLKRLLERVEACAPIVLYFDEFDKLFAASSESGEDTNSRQILGTLLTWLQEKTSATFVVATLNRLDALPPELTRVGRFDEIFYVGFPQAIERKEILMMHLARFDEHYRNNDPLTEKEWRIILNKTLNCTGAELARMVEKAARALFHQGREMKIGLLELLEQREMMVPLYTRDTDRILAIENRAKYICQPASSLDVSEFAPVLTSFWGEVNN
ncbi:AAA ATPase central domain protein [Calothrix sp. PCC 7716]|nr:AAA ATPase central domain protein [Calothrix sp. PCC 7716]